MTDDETGTNGFAVGQLGRTGVKVGRLGVAGGYGAPAAAFEMAFERGCNYFYHGSFRRKGMTEAIRNITKKGKREELVIVDQVYMRGRWLFRRTFDSFFKKTGVEYADVLLLGWWNKTPKQKVLDLCAELKEKGLYRYLGISGHNRKAFPVFAETGLFDVFHVRYNAGHRGAESEVFPHLPAENRPGVVTYTATRWGSLIKPKKMPPGENTPTAADCYRFVLTNPVVDVCMSGPKNMEQMQHALTALDKGPLTEDELAWMRRVGDHVHG